VSGACSNAPYDCKLCLNNFGGKGCVSRCSSTFDEEEAAGGFSLEASYNKGPYSASARYQFDDADYDYDEEAAGGFSLEASYNKGPYSASARYEFDEVQDEAREPSSTDFSDNLRERIKSRLFIKWARASIKKEISTRNNW